MADHRRVIIGGDADEDARAAACEAGGDDASRFHRLPGELEQQPMLRIDLPRLAGRHAEEIGVEQIDPVEEAAGFGVDALRRVAAFRVKAEIPAAAIDFADAIATGDQVGPERVEVRRFRVATAQADDGDRGWRSVTAGYVEAECGLRALGGFRLMIAHTADPCSRP